MDDQDSKHSQVSSRGVRCRVFIRHDTDSWSSLIAIFVPKDDSEAKLPRPEPIRAANATSLVKALCEAQVPEADVVFESPEEDNSDGALSRKQFASVQEAMSHYSTGSDRIPG